MAKTRLCFNATDDIDNVGAWVRAGTDGDKIGSQTYNSEEWLNVAAILTDSSGAELGSVANPLNVTGVDLEVDLSHLDDSVRLGDGTDFFTSTTVGADIGLDVNLINASIAVTQGTDPWIIGDGGGSITIDAVDLDIRDLSAAQDSVQSNLFDGSGTALTSTLIGSDQALDVNVVTDGLSTDDTANTDCSFSATSVDNTAGGTDLVATDLAGRKYLKLYNNGNQTVYIGESGVTDATGFPLDPCSYLDLRAGASCDLYAIGATAAAQDIRIMELS